jgi:hypothetical protein
VVPAAFLVSTRGVCFEFAHQELTPPVAAAVEPMLSRVRELIRRHGERCQEPFLSSDVPVAPDGGKKGP